MALEPLLHERQAWLAPYAMEARRLADTTESIAQFRAALAGGKGLPTLGYFDTSAVADRLKYQEREEEELRSSVAEHEKRFRAADVAAKRALDSIISALRAIERRPIPRLPSDAEASLDVPQAEPRDTEA